MSRLDRNYGCLSADMIGRRIGGTARSARHHDGGGTEVAAPRLMLRESVYESTNRLLMDADLQPGTRLSIDGLSRALQVSPTPVREALFRCEAEGLVVRRPNAVYTVAQTLSWTRVVKGLPCPIRGSQPRAPDRPLVPSASADPGLLTRAGPACPNRAAHSCPTHADHALPHPRPRLPQCPALTLRLRSGT
jgi:DNA-binding transcriptional MocR family regulator